MPDIQRDLDCRTLFRASAFDEIDVNAVIASDLMSDVLAAEAENAILVTSLASEQTLRTADVVEAAAVLIVNGKTIHPRMTALAAEFDITLMTTSLDKFSACVALGNLMDAT